MGRCLSDSMERTEKEVKVLHNTDEEEAVTTSTLKREKGTGVFNPNYWGGKIFSLERKKKPIFFFPERKRVSFFSIGKGADAFLPFGQKGGRGRKDAQSPSIIASPTWEEEGDFNISPSCE